MSQQVERPRLGAHEAQRIRVNLLRVAGLAAGLGVLMEAILVVGATPRPVSAACWTTACGRSSCAWPLP